MIGATRVVVPANITRNLLAFDFKHQCMVHSSPTGEGFENSSSSSTLATINESGSNQLSGDYLTNLTSFAKYGLVLNDGMSSNLGLLVDSSVSDHSSVSSGLPSANSSFLLFLAWRTAAVPRMVAAASQSCLH